MQAIIRFSLNNDVGSPLRNRLEGILVAAGFARGQNTATYRHEHIEPPQMSTTLRDFWAAVAAHQAGGRVDHFWMYTDRGFLDDMFGGAPNAGDAADNEDVD
ncbi:hypothetical protein GCM10010991_28580 [Gemmobacter aquaticus]|uniref:Uncharacterized protein n=2 Tax=Gemmobacter aquaticus TaxID=490185 RepID=A0A917YL50_9RHOB|nr:hypothetical protein GCM10010991_28580 [Gemmobacter aquaticus]